MPRWLTSVDLACMSSSRFTTEKVISRPMLSPAYFFLSFWFARRFIFSIDAHYLLQCPLCCKPGDLYTVHAFRFLFKLSPPFLFTFIISFALFSLLSTPFLSLFISLCIHLTLFCIAHNLVQMKSINSLKHFKWRWDQ